MDFSKLNTQILRQVLKLSERKETLLEELEKIESEIFATLQGNTTTPSSGIKKSQSVSEKGNANRLGRGMMKQNILEALAESGSAGLKVPELSKKINATGASLHVWFSNVGKNLAEIEKIGAGHFRIRQ